MSCVEILREWFTNLLLINPGGSNPHFILLQFSSDMAS